MEEGVHPDGEARVHSASQSVNRVGRRGMRPRHFSWANAASPPARPRGQPGVLQLATPHSAVWSRVCGAQCQGMTRMAGQGKNRSERDGPERPCQPVPGVQCPVSRVQSPVSMPSSIAATAPPTNPPTHQPAGRQPRSRKSMAEQSLLLRARMQKQMRPNFRPSWQQPRRRARPPANKIDNKQETDMPCSADHDHDDKLNAACLLRELLQVAEHRADPARNKAPRYCNNTV